MTRGSTPTSSTTSRRRSNRSERDGQGNRPVNGIPENRREDCGARRLARRAAERDTHVHPRGRPFGSRRVEVDELRGVVARRGGPHDGVVAAAKATKSKVRLTFAHGASLPDSGKLFNASLDADTMRTIDILEGDCGRRGRAAGAGAGGRRLQRQPGRRGAGAASQAAIRRSRKATATPPCRPTSRRCRAGRETLDAASTRSSSAPCPDVRKAVRWNSPLYGVEGLGFFPELPRLHSPRASDFLPRRIAGARATRQAEGPGLRVISTSTRANSTRSRWQRGCGRRPPGPAGSWAEVAPAH